MVSNQTLIAFYFNWLLATLFANYLHFIVGANNFSVYVKIAGL